MKKSDSIVLNKILKEIAYLQSKTDNIISFEDFDKDEDKKRIVAMTLINIGELTRHISQECKDLAKDIPFKNIIGLRDVAAHGYHSLKSDSVWGTVKTSIPDFKSKIEKLLARTYGI